MSLLDPQELKWQARDDAYALARAEEVKRNGDRLKRAQDAAGEILKERSSDLQGLAAVAGKSSPVARIVKDTSSPSRSRPDVTGKDLFLQAIVEARGY